MVVGALLFTGSIGKAAYDSRGGRKTASDIAYRVDGNDGNVSIKSDKSRAGILADLQKFTADIPFAIPIADGPAAAPIINH
jgi:hypothetical protein